LGGSGSSRAVFYRGHDGVRAGMVEFHKAWKSATLTYASRANARVAAAEAGSGAE
jgi:hypothetical protein